MYNCIQNCCRSTKCDLDIQRTRLRDSTNSEWWWYTGLYTPWLPVQSSFVHQLLSLLRPAAHQSGKNEIHYNLLSQPHKHLCHGIQCCNIHILKYFLIRIAGTKNKIELILSRLAKWITVVGLPAACSEQVTKTSRFQNYSLTAQLMRQTQLAPVMLSFDKTAAAVAGPQ